MVSYRPSLREGSGNQTRSRPLISELTMVTSEPFFLTKHCQPIVKNGGPTKPKKTPVCAKMQRNGPRQPVSTKPFLKPDNHRYFFSSHFGLDTVIFRFSNTNINMKTNT